MCVVSSYLTVAELDQSMVSHDPPTHVNTFLPEAARQWLGESARVRDGDPTELLREQSAALIPQYLSEWGSDLPTCSEGGWTQCQARVAGALAYHWWRFCQQQYVPLVAAVHRIQSGTLAYGRVNGDVLRDVTLAEGCCSGDEKAASHFVEEYSSVISALARDAGGPRAEQELQGFDTELMMPRQARPPRLALFAAHTPLKPWLRRVVRNEWMTRERRSKVFFPEAPPEDADPGPGPQEVAEGHQCLEVLQPLFREAVTALDEEESLLLRMVLLDGVSQQGVAMLWQVHKSTITRMRQKACRKLQQRFLMVARRGSERPDAEICLKWLMQTRSPVRRALAGEFAEALRGRGS